MFPQHNPGRHQRKKGCISLKTCFPAWLCRLQTHRQGERRCKSRSSQKHLLTGCPQVKRHSATSVMQRSCEIVVEGHKCRHSSLCCSLRHIQGFFQWLMTASIKEQRVSWTALLQQSSSSNPLMLLCVPDQDDTAGKSL